MSRIEAVLACAALLLAGCFMSLDENRWKTDSRGDRAARDLRSDLPGDTPQGEARPDVPIDQPAADLPGSDGPTPDTTRTDGPKPDAKKIDAPKPDAKKIDAPKPDAKKIDAPKPDLLKPDTKKIDAAKPDLPKPDLPPSCAAMNLTLQAAPDDGELWETDFYPDGETFSGAVNVIFLGFDNSTLWGFFRFTLTQAIPAGSTITSATLTLWGEGSWQWSSNRSLDVRAELAANAPAVTGVGDTPGTPSTGRPLTTALVRWPASGGLPWTVGGDNATPSLAPLFQEVVVSKSGLASGSHVQLWIHGTQTTDGAVRTVDFKAPGYSNHPAKLNLTFCK